MPPCACRRRCKRYAEQLRQEHGVNVQIRVGVNTGEVVVRSIRTDDLHTDYVPIGHATSLAARMESLATPGSIVVSEPTYRLTEGYFDFQCLGGSADQRCQRAGADLRSGGGGAAAHALPGGGPARPGARLSAGSASWSRCSGPGAGAGGPGPDRRGGGRARRRQIAPVLRVQAARASAQWLVLETFSVSHGKAYPVSAADRAVEHYFASSRPQDDERSSGASR